MKLTPVLIAANVVAYIWLTATGGLSSDRALFDHGALLGRACIYLGQWWRIITAAFLHGGIIHIAMNMLALYVLGNDVELLFGKLRFFLVYSLSLIGSGLAVVFFAPADLTVGASGAIFGLFGALLAIGLRLGSRGQRLIGRMLPILGLNLILTFTIPNISAAGHIGGLITGVLVGLIVFMTPSRQRAFAYTYVAGPEEPAPVETIAHPPDAGPHEEAHSAPLEVRDPRE